MTRQQLVAAALAALLVTTLMGPALAAPPDSDEDVSGAAARIPDLVGFSTPEDVVTYGADDHPGFIVYYDDGKYASLVEWIDSSPDRELIANNNASNRALVSAPPPAVFGGLATTEREVLDRSVPWATWVGTGLKDKSWIAFVDVNIRMAYAEPVEPGNESDVYRKPIPDPLVRGEFATGGLAFDSNTNESTIGDVRSTIGADSASVNGSGVRVAVLDTGVNTKNGQLFGNGSHNSTTRITQARNFITEQDGNASNGFENVSDGSDSLHGTWVASAIAANSSDDTYDGIAPGAELVVGKVLNDDGSGTTQNIVEGIEWAERNGSDIISLSLGSPIYSPTIATAIEDALAGNVTMVVVAVGNSRMNPGARYISSPADTDHPGVVGVAASTTQAPNESRIAYFSEVGPDSAREDLSRGQTAGEGPDIAAPGMKVEARTYTESGFARNTTLSGTSMATPIVAGALALELDKHSGQVNESKATREWLLSTASPMRNGGTTEVGAGQVNVSRLLNHTNSTLTNRDIRTATATSRDVANTATSGSRIFRVLSAARGVEDRTPIVG